jgi:pimeloyl-ACP methyl ester carboxylesterase
MSGIRSSVFVRSSLGKRLSWATRLAAATLGCLLPLTLVASANAQPAAPAAAPSKPAAPVVVALDTGAAGDPAPIALQAIYYASNLEENAIPVVLLHMYKGSSADYGVLAAELQKVGHAVLVPDLRGHGASNKFQSGAPMDPVKAAQPVQLTNMFQYDAEACRIFLQSKKNINIEKLCVVGAEMGAAVALNYAAWDWHWPDLGGKKQGQYVKALVLISPDMSFKSLSVKQAINVPVVRGGLSILMIVGTTRGDGAKRLDKIFTQNHPVPAAPQNKDYFFKKVNTTLKGTDMLGKQLNIETYITQFIDLRLVDKKQPVPLPQPQR